MTRSLFVLFMSLLFCPSLFAQLGNQNMILIANKDEHITGSQRYSAIWGYLSPTGREYAILGCHTGTVFYDVTDSANIVEVGFVQTPAPISSSGNGWREMKVYSHYAYIVSEASNTAIQIVDLQYLPDSVRYVGKFTLPGHSRTHTISQDGPYLYLNGCNSSFGNGTKIVDLTSNPEVPVLRGSWNQYYVHDSRIIDDTMYLSNIYEGLLSMVDITNKDNPQTITSFSTIPNPFTHNSALTTDKKYIFTTDETDNPPGKLKVWNIEDLNNIMYVNSWTPTGITTSIVHNVEIYGDYALIAHYTAGIRLLDISDPTNPTEVAWYDSRPSTNTNTFTGCWGVYMFPSGKIIASDMNTGLYVLKPTITMLNAGNVSNTIPENFRLEQNFPNPFNPSTMIKFSLPKNTNVSLKVFNMSGKEVAQIINDRRDAGNYEVWFDASEYSLTSGIYFYELKTNDSKIVKKMAFVK